ncbi:MAG: Holliday junction resolvase RuvX [Bacteroidales bacterium]|nr:Holliday junction resolvase RuvX [Bacteroidales bacterium]
MGRILAIDYGKKRAGLAVSDPMKMIANGLTTVHPNELLDYLCKYLDKEQVEIIVVGYPKQMNNHDSESVQYIKPFLKKLKEQFPNMPVELEDERFTSRMAQDAMLQGGMKKKQRQNKANVDKISATIILQSFLERKIS